MSLFLHLNLNLAVELPKYSSEVYIEVLEKLKNFPLLYSTSEFRIIQKDYLKREEPTNDTINHSHWNFPESSAFVLSNEAGLKVIFDPELHLEYISRKRTRQGFNLFLEKIIKNAENFILFKFFIEEEDQINEIPTPEPKEIQSYEEFMSKIYSAYTSEGKSFIYYNMQVINEFSDFFYLKSKEDFELLMYLYVGHPAKFKILLKKPERKIKIIKKGQVIWLDFLENHEVFMHLLENNPQIDQTDIFNPNLKDKIIYSEYHPEVIIIDAKQGSVRLEKCRCGGDKINGICSIFNCPFSKVSAASVVLKNSK